MEPHNQVAEKQELPISPQEVKDIQALTGGNAALTIVLVIAVFVYRVKGTMDTNTKASDKAFESLEQRLSNVERSINKCRCGETTPSILAIDEKLGALIKSIESKND
jgi:hypothetical protein